jgi:hypothetical protein
MFAMATPERPAAYFTVLGEPPLKMLRYQQQFDFFDLDKLNRCIRLVNLGEEAASGDLDKVLAGITAEVETHQPAFVCVDSFRSVMMAGLGSGRAYVPFAWAPPVSRCFRPRNSSDRRSARRLRPPSRTSRWVCRGEDVTAIAAKILAVLSKVDLSGAPLPPLSATIGISLYPDDGLDAATLIGRADSAMYLAKKNGRNRYACYAAGMGAAPGDPG